LATVLLGDGHGTGVQTQRAARITESAPHTYGLARGLRGQVGGGGPPLRPLLPHRKDPGDRGLLEHDLTDEDRPRTGVEGAPGKIASMGFVPCENRCAVRVVAHLFRDFGGLSMGGTRETAIPRAMA